MAAGSDKALREFLSEAQEIVETLGASLLSIDSARSSGERVDPDLVNACFRAVHSLKGLAGLFGLAQTSELAHALENLLDAIRLGKVEPRPEILDVLFEAVELFNRGLAAAADGGDLGPDDVAGYLARLDQATRAPEQAAPDDEDSFGGYQIDAGLLSVLTEYEEHRLRENIRTGAVIYRLHGSFDLMAIDRGIEEIKARVKPVGEILTYLPSGDSSDPNALELDILVATAAGDKALAEALEGVDVDLGRVPRREPAQQAPAVPQPTPAPPVEPAVAKPESPEPPPPASEADEALGSLRSVSQSVRVDIRKLDALMNAVGELGLVQTGLVELLEHLVDQQMVDESQALRHEVRALERKLAELQSGILEVRMVPLRQVFDKLSRVVRKVSRSLGKQIRLEISGADTELDKLIVEELSDPLMHIIRNAIDHGLESPAERAAAGKSEVGTIRVRAFQQGNRVLVSVTDDGRGIDAEAVSDAAVKRGLVDTSQVGEMTRRDIHNLLFVPGMSTREEATEISGRGVGLDVVKTNIANLSGIIDLSSTPGLGTQVTITLPITLAIIQAIIARVAGETYAIPLNSVVESLMVEPDEIQTIEGKEVLSIRRQTLRLVRIEEIFELQRSEEPVVLEQGDMLDPRDYVVVVGIAQHRVGLVVDELVGQQDIVIKSLGRALSGLTGIAGATELAGQKTVLVLDIPSLVEAALSRGPTVEAA
jgi:two-component system chemotaxis sensor kinase CheA